MLRFSRVAVVEGNENGEIKRNLAAIDERAFVVVAVESRNE